MSAGKGKLGEMQNSLFWVDCWSSMTALLKQTVSLQFGDEVKLQKTASINLPLSFFSNQDFLLHLNSIHELRFWLNETAPDLMGERRRSFVEIQNGKIQSSTLKSLKINKLVPKTDNFLVPKKRKTKKKKYLAL